MISNPEAAVETASRIISSAQSRETDALILSCPLCEYNLGRRQGDIIAKHSEIKPIPTYYFTQLLAVALGLDEDVCHFELNVPGARPLLEEKKILGTAVS